MTQPQPTPQESLASLRDFLTGLEPEDEVTIFDASNRPHRIWTVLPARRHIRALRILDEAMKKISAEEVDPTAKGMRSLLAKVRKAIHNEDLMIDLGKVFSEAYPEVVAEAAKGQDSSDPLDLFPLEAILEGLAPLLSRLLVKALAMAEKKGKSQTTQPEA